MRKREYRNENRNLTFKRCNIILENYLWKNKFLLKYKSNLYDFVIRWLLFKIENLSSLFFNFKKYIHILCKKKKETRVNSMVDRIRGGQVVVLSEI